MDEKIPTIYTNSSDGVKKHFEIQRKNLIEFAKNILQKGGLVIFPTETVYGIGGNANNSKAVKLIFDKKNSSY